MEIIIGALIFLAGYLTCFFSVKKQVGAKEIITEVKRIKPSFKNPLRPYNVAYEKYKARGTGLFEPQMPKRGE